MLQNKKVIFYKADKIKGSDGLYCGFSEDVVLLSDHQKAVRNLKRDFLGRDKSQQIKEVFDNIEKLFPEDLCDSTRIVALYIQIKDLKQQLTKKDEEIKELKLKSAQRKVSLALNEGITKQALKNLLKEIDKIKVVYGCSDYYVKEQAKQKIKECLK